MNIEGRTFQNALGRKHVVSEIAVKSYRGSVCYQERMVKDETAEASEDQRHAQPLKSILRTFYVILRTI